MPMNTLKAKRCASLISQYRQDVDNTELRNYIYELSRPAIIKCLKKSTRKPLTDCELLSMSWDVFLLCVYRHSETDAYQVTLVNAVHTVLNKMSHETKKKNSNEKNVGDSEYPEPEYTVSDTIALRDSLLALKDFRESLPVKYRIVLDDCLASLGEDTRSRQSRVKMTKLPSHRYYEAKKVMTWAIEHILGRKENGKSKSAGKLLRKRDSMLTQSMVYEEKER